MTYAVQAPYEEISVICVIWRLGLVFRSQNQDVSVEVLDLHSPFRVGKSNEMGIVSTQLPHTAPRRWNVVLHSV